MNDGEILAQQRALNERKRELELLEAQTARLKQVAASLRWCVFYLGFIATLLTIWLTTWMVLSALGALLSLAP